MRDAEPHRIDVTATRDGRTAAASCPDRSARCPMEDRETMQATIAGAMSLPARA